MMSRPVRILQFGATGQVAREVLRAADERFEVGALTREDADFRRPQLVSDALEKADAVDVVVNAAAYTAVDKAESEEVIARAINGDSVGVLARACAERGLPLIHLSTDYVFDGSKSAPYVEEDAPNPMSAYGRSKLAGEAEIQAAGGKHVILRTSWIYSAHGSNFLRTILRLGTERRELRVVDDQRGAPTAAASVARAILTMAEHMAHMPTAESFGTFHFTDAGETTWRNFAEAIFARAGMEVRVIPITTAEYSTPARRPLNSRLNCSKIARVHSAVRPHWQLALANVMDELRTGGSEI